MEVRQKRQPSVNGHTLGTITIDGFPDVFPTIEDEERDTNNNGFFDNGEKKVYGKTAIPKGRYRIVLDVVSPKFSKYPFYMEVCGGKLPRLLDVPSFEGVLQHCGRNENQSSGCQILNDYNAPLERSKKYFRRYMEILSSAKDDIYITIE